MKIFHDWEFVDDGQRILPLSVGMVREDGTELYAVFDDVHEVSDMFTGGSNYHVMTLAYRHLAADDSHWLADNVLRHLPVRPVEDYPEFDNEWVWQDDHPDRLRVHKRAVIRKLVHQFIAATPNPELWAYYGAYDHVCLGQLFGPMSLMPRDIPWYTNDLMTRVGTLQLPQQPPERQHHALMDAWQELAWDRWLDENGRGRW